MSQWMTDEEIEDLKKKPRPLTGNDFVDAYYLGFDAGKSSLQRELDDVTSKKSELFWDKMNAEKRADDFEKENAELKKKISKLKKRCRALAERERGE